MSKSVYPILFSNGTLHCIFSTKEKAKDYVKKHPDLCVDWECYGVDGNE